MIEINRIYLKDFSLNFKSKTDNIVLFNNSFITINKGESVSIIGVSGSGKSTLLSLLSGLIKPTSGLLFYNDINIFDKNESELSQIRRKNFSFIFQHPYFLENLSILDNAILYLCLKEKPFNIEKLKDTLYLFNLKQDIHIKTKYLSGGERARLSIVFSLLCENSFIFADEITSSLDSDNAKLVEDLLFDNISKFNKTLILVTHSSSFASRCKSQYIIENKSLKKIC